ncbi:MAG: PEPxxWA-CTERM sorting domain-containing protein [Sphingomonas sp.]|nr:PEPxxWA-CTERM sorting domain-containing protein [Sphingomonas sp.]
MLHKHIMRFLTALSALVGLAAIAAPAAAVDFKFSGTCIDCSGIGSGTLVLKNYTLGTTLTTANFVSFTYSSNLLSYSLSSVDDLTGSLTAATGPAFVVFHGGGYTFDSLVAGPFSPWCTGTTGACSSDFGLISSWSQVAGVVPEPAMWAVMVLGFGLLGASMRRPRHAGLLHA